MSDLDNTSLKHQSTDGLRPVAGPPHGLSRSNGSVNYGRRIQIGSLSLMSVSCLILTSISVKMAVIDGNDSAAPPLGIQLWLFAIFMTFALWSARLVYLSHNGREAEEIRWLIGASSPLALGNIGVILWYVFARPTLSWPVLIALFASALHGSAFIVLALMQLSVRPAGQEEVR